jgi:hypothetical protein
MIVILIAERVRYGRKLEKKKKKREKKEYGKIIVQVKRIQNET